MSESENKVLFKICAALQKEINDLKKADDILCDALHDLEKMIVSIQTSSVYDFVHKIEGNTFDEIDRRLNNVETKTKYDHLNLSDACKRIEKLEDHVCFNKDNRSDLNASLLAIQNEYKQEFEKINKLLLNNDNRYHLIQNKCPVCCGTGKVIESGINTCIACSGKGIIFS